MDATDLKFEPESFDHIVSVATTHHLSDGQLANMLSTTMRLLRSQGHLHIVDAVLPANRLNLLKEAWFRLDRGQYPRYREQLESRLRACDEPGLVEVRRESPLHDIMYARLTKN
jgi:cyclopropane fatty-acyl-phospholipid synthase-like methyltransferase